MEELVGAHVIVPLLLLVAAEAPEPSASETALAPAPLAGPPSRARPTPTRAHAARAEPAGAPVAVGVSGVVAGWTGGEVLIGADLVGQVRVVGRLVAELRLGGRRTRAIDLTTGSMDGHGAAGAVGLLVEPFEARSLGVSVGARLSGDWLRYLVVDQRTQGYYGSADVGAVSVVGTAAVFARLLYPVRITLDVAAGGALHSVVIRERDRRTSGLSGLLLSTAAGLAVEF